MASCEWCGEMLPDRVGPGRKRQFCNASHRQLAYEARRQISVRDVASRVGWTCHICGEGIDPAVCAPSARAATVDHVIPLRRGGTDDDFNTLLAHFGCNRSKGAHAPAPAPTADTSRDGPERHVTDRTSTAPCRWCGRPVAQAVRPGRRREFCGHSCRQRDYEARLRTRELGLSESELIVTRQALEEMHDALYVLEAAIEDVDRDLESAKTAKDYREALDWLLKAARPLIDRRLT
jgi:5-methylcytosine-specific restriction endonuclease McrA